MDYLEDLIEPGTHQPLKYNRENNSLQGSVAYPVIDTIPSFIGNKNFAGHWENHATTAIPQSKLAEADRFLQPVFDYQAKQRRRLKMLDAGCGDGIHLIQIRNNEQCSKQNSVAYGVDISGYALQMCRKRLQNDWPLIQCDIERLPFKQETFDISFSFGVLGYTDNPFKGFEELVRTTKKGGLIGLWLYPRRTGMGGMIFRFVRKLCQLTGRPGTAIIANMIVPFLGFLPTASKMSLANASWKQCREVVMVNVAPKQLFFPREEEIVKWFEQQDIKLTINDRARPITLWGIRQ